MSIKLKHSGGNSVSLNPPTSAPTSSEVAFKLPTSDGSAGQILTTDGSGNLSWKTPSKILQVVSITKTDVSSISTSGDTFYNYDDASLKVTLTPSSASNKILILGDICVSSHTNVERMFVRLNKNGSFITGAVGDADGNRARSMTSQRQQHLNYPTFHSISFLDTAGDTNSRYYNVAVAQDSGSGRNVQFNRSYNDNNSFSYARYSSTLTAMEIAA